MILQKNLIGYFLKESFQLLKIDFLSFHSIALPNWMKREKFIE